MKRNNTLPIFYALFVVLLIASTGIAGPDGRLKIYCGITMIQAMGEIGHKMEDKFHCKPIKFVKGGSGELLRELLENQDGDLYLPGRDSYIDQLKSGHPDFVIDEGQVGFNRAAIIFKKENPKEIKGGISTLLRSDLNVIIGDDSIGSIGKETKSLLVEKGIYQQVRAKALLATHSKTLTIAVKTGDADVAVNWFATLFWPENSRYLEGYPIDSPSAGKEKLVLTILKTTNQRELAKAFLEMALSTEGKEIFKQYGLQ